MMNEEAKRKKTVPPGWRLGILACWLLTIAYLVAERPAWETAGLALGASLGAVFIGIYWHHVDVRRFLWSVALFFAVFPFLQAWGSAGTQERVILALAVGLFLLLGFRCDGYYQRKGDDGDT
ncbi:MAG: hypothetical protein KM310_11540 [Clostridiales bacterium]|nr:hypothetical protein [Clostridiales bacterium]